MQTRPLFMLLLGGCLGTGGPNDSASDTGTDTDTGTPGPRTLTLEAYPSAPYLSDLHHGPDGLYANSADGLYRTADGVEWTRVTDSLHDANWTDDGTLHGLVFDKTVGVYGGHRVIREVGGTRTVLDTPWESIDVADVDLAASGDTLWVMVAWRSSDTSLGQARFWRWGPADTTFVEVSAPTTAADVASWALAPDGEGGIWAWDRSSAGPYTLHATDDGTSWTELWQSTDVVVSDVVHTAGGSWLMGVGGPDASVRRSTDNGQSFTEVVSGPFKIEAAPGGRIAAMNWLENGTVWFSEDDGQTWTADADTAYTQYMLDWAALDDRVVGAELGLVAVREDGEPWGIRALPAGPGHDYLALHFAGDRGILSLRDDYLVLDTTLQATLITSDGGESWSRTAASPWAAGTAVCGGPGGWFVGGTTGMNGPEGLGLGFAYLSADGREVVLDGVKREVRGTFANQADFRFWEHSGEIVDCEWDDNSSLPGGGHVSFAFATDDLSQGVLVEGAGWVDLGPATDRAVPVALKGGSYNAQVAVRDTASGLYQYWNGSELIGWSDLPVGVSVLDGSAGAWTFSDGSLGAFGYEANGSYQTIEVLLEDYPETNTGPVAIRASATNASDHVWVATAEGMYRTAEPLFE